LLPSFSKIQNQFSYSELLNLALYTSRKVAGVLVILSELPTFVLLEKTCSLWLKNRGFTNGNFEVGPPRQFAKQIILQPKFAL
jgi:hypothetical protein